MLTLDVACFFGGSYYFCVQILKKKEQKKNEVEKDVIEEELMKKTYLN